MTSKLIRHFWFVILVLVIACREQTGSVTPTIMPTSTSDVTSTLSPMPVSPSRQVTSTPTSFSVSSPPSGLLMAYIMQGNLHFQEGSNSAVQLTHSGKDWHPILSEDGEKIVFYRGKDWDEEEIHSINRDGSQEQVLVTNKLLRAFDNSYNESTRPYSLTLVPSTHFLLFTTGESNMTIWNSDLFIVDIDTAKMKRLFPPGKVRDFYVSPDGEFIAIDTIGRIDVVDIEGKIIRQNLLTYTPSEPTFLAPDISWISDSKRLIVTLPVATYYETSASGPSYTVWHYTLEEGKGAQIPLDVLPTEVYMATVSPDGHWVIYNNNDQYAFYLGNLREGTTQLYEPNTFVFHYEQGWSPDSRHFIYRGTRDNLFLGSINSSPELIGKGDFIGWIDANRYLYYVDKTVVMGDVKELKEIILADREFFNSPDIFTFILPQT